MLKNNQVISEVFMSIEGEAKYSGHPTVYIRYAGCKKFVPADITSINNMPTIEMGCDSQYAVNPAFSHLWEHLTVDQLLERLMQTIPHNKWVNPITNNKYILSLTGGEPTLRWKTIIDLLNHDGMRDVNHILIETNCAVPLKDQFIQELSSWSEKRNGKITWSNSPKLSVSGEPQEKAIRPEIAVKQLNVINSEQYFKFVCDDTVESFEEVKRIMNIYYQQGVQRENNIYIMPMSCTEQQQTNIMRNVADLCIQYGFIYCHRIHNTVYENQVGK